MSDLRGMFVDTSICTGCKACQVACKQWNEMAPGVPLPMEDEAAVREHRAFTGNSYDNTGHLSATNWRHVKFIEQIGPDPSTSDRSDPRWLMMSDSCKHCVQAGCLEVCPTGALYRTSFGSVDIHQDVCIGCRYCVGACPFGVIAFNQRTGRVNKCILCQDRLEIGMGTACAKACPTSSLTFGAVDDLKAMANDRVKALHARGQTDAYIYGWDLGNTGTITAGPNKGTAVKDVEMVGGLNVFYLLLDKPEVYGLPAHAALPQRNFVPSAGVALISAAVLGVTGLAAFRRNRIAENAAAGTEAPHA
jgi:formate dehydrogenase iron-sulfur subunit